MYQKIVYLRQQSPYIHFQNNFPGATLRASDVKPRLDKFLYEKCAKMEPFWKLPSNSQEMANSDLANNELNSSLNYKLQIAVDGHAMELIPKVYPCFFGNTGTKENEATQKKFSFTTSVKLIFKSYFKDLLDLIVDKYIQDFFVTYNFGTRSSKGFGGFVVVPTEMAEVINNDFEARLRSQFEMVFKFSKVLYNYEDYIGDHKLMFTKIDEAYKELKGGLQRSPSKLRKYFNALHPSVEWEKAKTTEILKANVDPDVKVDKLHNNIYYIRGLLGLAENYEYDRIRIKSKFAIKHKDETIERFPSPILVKIFDNSFYFCLTKKAIDSLDEIAGENFVFTMYKGEKQFPAGNFTLQVPAASTFDIGKFLQVALVTEKWKKIK